MNTMISNSMVENYYRFIKSWDSSSRKKLIDKLTISITSEEKNQADFSDCFGAWEDKRSAEEIVLELEAARVNQKEGESF